MAVKKITAPVALQNTVHTCCPGCGHGLVYRIICEVIEEMGLNDKALWIEDVACGSIVSMQFGYNKIMGAHGRVIPTACGAKRARPDMLVIGYAGDGATYSIGMQHTVHAAARNEGFTMICTNNTVYGMTGGQMSPESLIGQKTTSSPAGRDVAKQGSPINVENLLSGMDIAYLARGAVDSVADINKTKGYIKKAFTKQMAGEGYTYVEVLSPCPTNWALDPQKSIEFLQENVMKQYPIGEFIDKK